MTAADDIVDVIGPAIDEIFAVRWGSNLVKREPLQSLTSLLQLFHDFSVNTRLTMAFRGGLVMDLWLYQGET